MIHVTEAEMASLFALPSEAAEGRSARRSLESATGLPLQGVLAALREERDRFLHDADVLDRCYQMLRDLQSAMIARDGGMGSDRIPGGSRR